MTISRIREFDCCHLFIAFTHQIRPNVFCKFADGFRSDALISTLLESARQGIKDEKAKGNFLDVRPDELVGETLVQA
jgi:hypothetical protein